MLKARLELLALLWQECTDAGGYKKGAGMYYLMGIARCPGVIGILS